MALVHLSFDNGPDPEGTPLVLEALAARGLEATFFALGSKLDGPGGDTLAAEVLCAGHRLGNHTYHHETPLGRLDAAGSVAELARTDAAVRRVGGERLFRPYGGGGSTGPHLLSPEAADWLVRHAYTVVLWSSVPGDFRDPDGFVDRAVADCAAADRVTMVLHDAAPRSMRRLGELLDRLADAGHTFAPGWDPAHELMRAGRPTPALGRFVRSASQTRNAV